MSDSFSEVTGESWLSRLGGSIKSVLIGIVLFVVSFPLLWWNEGRAVHQAKTLTEAAGSLVSTSPDKVDPSLDTKLVYVTGTATTGETLADSLFGISEKAIKLHRNVEMYQWIQREESHSVKNVGGGRKNVKTYTYETGWSNKAHDSKKFKTPGGHANPKMRFPSETETAKLVTLGAMKLSDGLKGQMTAFEPIGIDDKLIEKLPEDCKQQAKIDGNALYLPRDAKLPAADPAKPEVGDLKIAFSAVRPGEVSIIARQVGDSFEPWQSAAGDPLEKLAPGVVSPETMIGVMEQDNANLTWILRGVGFLLMAFGIGLVFSPLVVLADVLPFLGDLLQMGVGLFAAMVAGSLSLLTIALAWIAYRPLLGVGLLAAALVLFVGLKALGRGRRGAAAG
jgi:hypothetical protein